MFFLSKLYPFFLYTLHKPGVFTETTAILFEIEVKSAYIPTPGPHLWMGYTGFVCFGLQFAHLKIGNYVFTSKFSVFMEVPNNPISSSLYSLNVISYIHGFVKVELTFHG